MLSQDIPVQGLDRFWLLLGATALSVAACAILLSYSYAVFAVTRSMGSTPTVRQHPAIAMLVLFVAASVMSLPMFIIPVELGYKVILAFAAWLLHGPIAFIGALVGMEDGSRVEQAEREQRAKEWISTWEYEHLED
ncbi:MAG: hypothetical protein HONBIEJF_00389 [Fimbriimonadaceae bacterium]|nr:hypothetical protein [Fimbriimonadaceae bacterium]